jgi:hypothetical protein
MNRAQAPALALLLAACAACRRAASTRRASSRPRTRSRSGQRGLDRNSDWLFVTNSNADLRYNDGTLVALSMERAAKDREEYKPGNDPPTTENHPDWRDCPEVNYERPRIDPRRFCCWDVVNHKRDALNCDERGYIDSDEISANPDVRDSDRGLGNVRIGSFAAGMVLQRAKCPVDYKKGQDQGRLACSTCDGLHLGARSPAARRPRRHLAHLHRCRVQGARYTAESEVCRRLGDPRRGRQRVSCDAGHRVIRAPSGLASVGNDPMPSDTPPPDVALPDEPYALAIDDDAGILFIGHLTGNTARAYTGGFSMFDIAPRAPKGPK